jgi:hypothetical protein
LLTLKWGEGEAREVSYNIIQYISVFSCVCVCVCVCVYDRASARRDGETAEELLGTEPLGKITSGERICGLGTGLGLEFRLAEEL